MPESAYNPFYLLRSKIPTNNSNFFPFMQPLSKILGMYLKLIKQTNLNSNSKVVVAKTCDGAHMTHQPST